MRRYHIKNAPPVVFYEGDEYTADFQIWLLQAIRDMAPITPLAAQYQAVEVIWNIDFKAKGMTDGRISIAVYEALQVSGLIEKYGDCEIVSAKADPEVSGISIEIGGV